MNKTLFWENNKGVFGDIVLKLESKTKALSRSSSQFAQEVLRDCNNALHKLYIIIPQIHPHESVQKADLSELIPSLKEKIPIIENKINEIKKVYYAALHTYGIKKMISIDTKTRQKPTKRTKQTKKIPNPAWVDSENVQYSENISQDQMRPIALEAYNYIVNTTGEVRTNNVIMTIAFNDKHPIGDSLNNLLNELQILYKLFAKHLLWILKERQKTETAADWEPKKIDEDEQLEILRSFNIKNFGEYQTIINTLKYAEFGRARRAAEALGWIPKVPPKVPPKDPPKVPPKGRQRDRSRGAPFRRSNQPQQDDPQDGPQDSKMWFCVAKYIKHPTSKYPNAVKLVYEPEQHFWNEIYERLYNSEPRVHQKKQPRINDVKYVYPVKDEKNAISLCNHYIQQDKKYRQGKKGGPRREPEYESEASLETLQKRLNMAEEVGNQTLVARTKKRIEELEAKLQKGGDDLFTALDRIWY